MEILLKGWDNLKKRVGKLKIKGGKDTLKDIRFIMGDIQERMEKYGKEWEKRDIFGMDEPRKKRRRR